ncbi:helix-turn-helix domain-containing protein, partial [Acetobacter pasteurianus]
VTPSQRLEIIKKRKNGEKLEQIAKAFGISSGTVYRIASQALKHNS